MRTLKDRNRWPLLVAMLSNLAFFYVVAKTGRFAPDEVEVLFKGWQVLIPAGATFIVASITTELLSPNAKARLVFWRWRYPLPGSYAFTKYGREDPRVDLTALAKKFGTLPQSPEEQNAFWYRLYRSTASDETIVQVHRNYLFTRDYTAISALLVPLLGISGLWVIGSSRIAMTYIGLLVAQYLVVRLAARNHGIRLVTSVMAIKSAE